MNQWPALSSVAFNIHVLPHRVQALLEVLKTDTWFSAEDLLQNATILDQLHVARYVKETTRLMVEAGLVQRKPLKPGFLYQLSDFGQLFCQTLSTRPQLYADIMHFLFFVLYEEQQRRSTTFSSWSWVYQSTCRLLWEVRPNVPTFSEQAAFLNHKLADEFPHYKGGVHTDAPNTVVLWLSQMQPPFLHLEGRSRRTCGRQWCSPELFVLGIDRLYRRESLSYNTPFLLSKKAWDELALLCLTEMTLLEEVFEVARSTFPFLKTHSGEWGRSVILEREITIANIL